MWKDTRDGGEIVHDTCVAEDAYIRYAWRQIPAGSSADPIMWSLAILHGRLDKALGVVRYMLETGKVVGR